MTHYDRAVLDFLEPLGDMTPAEKRKALEAFDASTRAAHARLVDACVALGQALGQAWPGRAFNRLARRFLEWWPK